MQRDLCLLERRAGSIWWGGPKKRACSDLAVHYPSQNFPNFFTLEMNGPEILEVKICLTGW